MDENEIKQELQDALDKQEHVEHPDEILKSEKEIIDTALFEEGEDENNEDDSRDGDS